MLLQLFILTDLAPLSQATEADAAIWPREDSSMRHSWSRGWHPQSKCRNESWQHLSLHPQSHAWRHPLADVSDTHPNHQALHTLILWMIGSTASWVTFISNPNSENLEVRQGEVALPHMPREILFLCRHQWQSAHPLVQCRSRSNSAWVMIWVKHLQCPQTLPTS